MPNNIVSLFKHFKKQCFLYTEMNIENDSNNYEEYYTINFSPAFIKP